MHGFIKGAHIALTGATVLSSWAFIQVMFALHYAHDYYTAVCQRRKAGLQFPDDEEPDHGDFFYFASVIGTSGQTADVSFVPSRRAESARSIASSLTSSTRRCWRC